MTSLKIALCIATCFVYSCWATVPYDDVKFNIFDKNPRDFETRVFESMQIIKNFYARKEVEAAANGVASAINLIPVIGSIGKVIPLIRSTLAEQSDWRASFTRTIVDETKREIAESEIRWMDATMETIQEKFNLLNEDNPDMENRKTVASIIHSDIDKMINFFALRTSLLKKYPLTGTPALLELASLVALFSPVARTLIPLESKNPQISCKMHDVLVDYRPRTVYARLDKLHATTTLFRDELAGVRSKAYNPNGYNQTNMMDCHSKGCKKTYFAASGGCLTDDFGEDELFTLNYMDMKCWTDYASYVRHRVEDVFPVHALEAACVDRKSRAPTGESNIFPFFSFFRHYFNFSFRKNHLSIQSQGFGWVTILIRQIYAHGNAEGGNCDSTEQNPCDPYIKLIINEKEAHKTRSRTDTCCFDANEYFVSERIAKSSTIQIEVWDDDSGFFGSADDLIQREVGSIASFIEKPVRYGAKVGDVVNSIEVAAFWRDEYVYN